MGDLALLYRTRPASDFAYLLQAVSLPEPDGDYGGARATYLCDAEVIEVFAPTLPFSSAWSDPVLNEQSFVRRKMNVSNPSISERAFLRLIELLEVNGNAGLAQRIPERVDDRLMTFSSEMELESWIYDHADTLGLWLDIDGLRPDAMVGTAGPGRQVSLRDGSRADLVLGNDDCRVVVEVKAGQADAAAVGQVAAYRFQLENQDPDDERWVRAVVVSGGTPRPGAKEIAGQLNVAVFSAAQLQSSPPPPEDQPPEVVQFLDLIETDRFWLSMSRMILGFAADMAVEGQLEIAGRMRDHARNVALGDAGDAVGEASELMLLAYGEDREDPPT